MSTETELQDVTRTWLELAEEVFKRQFKTPTISLKLRGTKAGTANSCDWELRFNRELYEHNKDDFANRTVPHEVAHLITDTLHPGSSAHGFEWKEVMHSLGVENTSRCHDYDTSLIETKVARPYLYKCNCTTHALTHTVHKRILQGCIRICNRCRKTIKLFSIGSMIVQ